MRTDTSQEALEQIVRRLVDGLQPEQIILFGSYADGEPREGSDVDLMIIVSESTESPHRRDQRAYRCLRGIKVSKDLMVLTRDEFERQARVATALARRVKDRGKVLYDRGETRRGLELADKEPA
ncbi:MAG: nucleotidyltransferase domain-containing protein [Candidatus Binatia bacterium]